MKFEFKMTPTERSRFELIEDVQRCAKKLQRNPIIKQSTKRKVPLVRGPS